MTWWTPSTPDNFKPTPWLHPAAVAYLETLVTRDMIVYEHGAGGSTLWFAKRAKELHSYETDPAWYGAVSQKVKAAENIFVHLSNDPPLFPDCACDLLFIDGYNGDRPRWMEAAPMMVKAGGIIVLDNAERINYNVARTHMAEFCEPPASVIAATNSGKIVVTEFYRLKGGVGWI